MLCGHILCGYPNLFAQRGRSMRRDAQTNMKVDMFHRNTQSERYTYAPQATATAIGKSRRGASVYTYLLPSLLLLATGCASDLAPEGIDGDEPQSNSTALHPSELAEDQMKPPSEQKYMAGSCLETCEDALDDASDDCGHSKAAGVPIIVAIAGQASCLKQAALDYDKCAAACNEDYPTPYFGSGKK